MGAEEVKAGVKAYRLVFTPGARRDLDGLTEAIAEDAGVALAKRWNARLRDQARQLRHFPFRGATDDQLASYRRLVVSPYLIVYRVDEPDKVSVLRILDGRRDLASIFQAAPKEA